MSPSPLWRENSDGEKKFCLPSRLFPSHSRIDFLSGRIRNVSTSVYAVYVYGIAVFRGKHTITVDSRRVDTTRPPPGFLPIP
jgi:hypothetical protein